MNRTFTAITLIATGFVALSAAAAEAGSLNYASVNFVQRPALMQQASLETLDSEVTQNAALDEVVARVDISEQRMYVYAHGELTHTFKVSTARAGYVTPTGTWAPTRMYRMWHSRKYDNSPMPNSVFFHGGYAVHGTNHVSHLGRPASHGCVRLHPDDARTFFAMVLEAGRANTQIVITR
jgi:lipoprotein-anchoring transpeptidase ErfK/SrfK